MELDSSSAKKTITAPTAMTAAPAILSAKAMPMVLTSLAKPLAESTTLSSNSNTAGNPTMTLSPEEVVLNRGKEFEVTLGLDQAVDICGILVAVDYDPDTLKLLGYTCGDIFIETQFTVQNDLSAAPYKLLATLDEIGTTSVDGSFVILKFKVKEDAEEKATAISLKTLEVVGENMSIPVDKGDDINMVVDETAPVIEGIVDGETYCPDQFFTISDTKRRETLPPIR